MCWIVNFEPVVAGAFGATGKCGDSLENVARGRQFRLHAAAIRNSKVSARRNEIAAEIGGAACVRCNGGNRYSPLASTARVCWSGPNSSALSMPINSASRVRARLTRDLMVPTAQSQICAASS
jgi:hypothetical protein